MAAAAPIIMAVAAVGSAVAQAANRPKAPSLPPPPAPVDTEETQTGADQTMSQEQVRARSLRRRAAATQRGGLTSLSSNNVQKSNLLGE